MERQRAPVAQLDRALASGARGRGFESRRVRHFLCLCAENKNHKKEKLKAFANKICNALGFLFLSGQLRIARVILGRVAFRFSPKGLRCSRSVASLGRIPPGAPFFCLRAENKNHKKRET